MPNQLIIPPQLPLSNAVSQTATAENSKFIPVIAADLFFVRLTDYKIVSGQNKLNNNIPIFGKPNYENFGTTVMNSVRIFTKDGVLSKLTKLKTYSRQELLASSFDQERDQLNSLHKTKESVISNFDLNKEKLNSLGDLQIASLDEILANVSPLILQVEPKNARESTSYTGLYVCDDAQIKSIYYQNNEKEIVQKYFGDLQLPLKPLSELQKIAE